MGFRRVAVNRILRWLVDSLCKIDSVQLREAVSHNKPMIVAMNHINFLDVPIIVSHAYPVYMTGLAKVETWKNPVFSYIFNTYKAIPIDRNGSFRDAFRKVREALTNGFFVIIAPEGTRSSNGVLGQGKAGIIQLALECNTPVLPVVHYGGEHFWKNIRRLKRTAICFKPGRPFLIKPNGTVGKSVRTKILDEIMGQMARLLPEELRGNYADQANEDCKYLEFV